MTQHDDPFRQALLTVLAEIFEGPPGEMAFLLNPGDPGLLRQLESLDAEAASQRPMPGRTTIASHVDHVLYGIELINRWAEGEENPWASADWEASWQRTTVDDEQWTTLVARLREASEAWRRHAAERQEWDAISAAGAVASAAHTAYHLGAIRQLLAAIRPE